MTDPHDDDDYCDDDDALLEEDCHEDADGHCDLVGTEWCDWSCPLADLHARERIAAMKDRQK